MIYTNTASVLGEVITDLTAAIGGDPHVTAILLQCTSQTARHRLSQREIGTGLDWHLQRSTQMARKLDNRAPHWVHRIDTDQRTVVGMAAEITGLGRLEDALIATISHYSANGRPPIPVTAEIAT